MRNIKLTAMMMLALLALGQAAWAETAKKTKHHHGKSKAAHHATVPASN